MHARGARRDSRRAIARDRKKRSSHAPFPLKIRSRSDDKTWMPIVDRAVRALDRAATYDPDRSSTFL